MKNYLVKKSICLNCSLGCGMAFRAEGEQIVALDYDQDNPVNAGSLCPRGHQNFELINHPQRLTKPRVDKRETSWEEAIDCIQQALKKVDKHEIGIMVSPRVSNADAAAVWRYAQAAGIEQVGVESSEADFEACVEEIRDPSRRATLEEIDKAENLLIIGDILERTPVLSKRINRVKYGKRGNKIIVVDPADTRTTWFATTHLRSLGNVMEGFNGVIIIVPGLEGSVVAAAQRVESAQYMVYYLGGNQLGVCQTLKERRGDTAGCKVFLSMEPNFSCRTAEHEILLPLASQFEAGGSFTLSGGREVKSEPIAPRVGTKTVAEIMTLIYG